MTTTFKIEDGISMPPRAIGRSGGESMYPFADMKAGQSFLVPVVMPENTAPDEKTGVFRELSQTISNRLAGAIRRYTSQHEGAKFSTRGVAGEGVRVWCVAQPANTPPAPPAPPASAKSAKK